MALPLHTVAIAGPGLIGGSLALCARNSGLEVAVWTPAEAEAAEVRAAGFVASTDPQVVGPADLLVLCVPIPAQLETGRRLAPALAAATTVTDAASVKGALEPGLRALFGARYVGAHPMAGKERAGFAAADAGLFQGRKCFIVPSAEAAQTERAARFWQTVGCELVETNSAEHDATVARISHLPVLAAAALVNAAGARPERIAAAGPGFRDTTRVASSPPALWREILSANRAEVLAALDEFEAELAKFRSSLSPGREARLEEHLTRAAATRSGLTLSFYKS